jgi:hypothetical protein
MSSDNPAIGQLTFIPFTVLMIAAPDRLRHAIDHPNHPQEE